MTKGSVINARPVNEYEFKTIKKLVAFNPTLFMIATIFLRGFTLKIEGIKYLQKNIIKTGRYNIFAWSFVFLDSNTFFFY